MLPPLNFFEVPKIKPTLFFGIFLVFEKTFPSAFFSINLFDKKILKAESIKQSKNNLNSVFFFIYRVNTNSFSVDNSSEKRYLSILKPFNSSIVFTLLSRM